MELREEIAESLTQRWSPQQISRQLHRRFPDDAAMRLCPESIYQAVYQPGSVLARPSKLAPQRRSPLRTGRDHRPSATSAIPGPTRRWARCGHAARSVPRPSRDLSQPVRAWNPAHPHRATKLHPTNHGKNRTPFIIALSDQNDTHLTAVRTGPCRAAPARIWATRHLAVERKDMS
jgi:hypothetical protein